MQRHTRDTPRPVMASASHFRRLAQGRRPGPSNNGICRRTWTDGRSRARPPEQPTWPPSTAGVLNTCTTSCARDNSNETKRGAEGVKQAIVRARAHTYCTRGSRRRLSARFLFYISKHACAVGVFVGFSRRMVVATAAVGEVSVYAKDGGSC